MSTAATASALNNLAASTEATTNLAAPTEDTTSPVLINMATLPEKVRSIRQDLSKVLAIQLNLNEQLEDVQNRLFESQIAVEEECVCVKCILK